MPKKEIPRWPSGKLAPIICHLLYKLVGLFQEIRNSMPRSAADKRTSCRRRFPSGYQEPAMKAAPYTAQRFNFSNASDHQHSAAPAKPAKPTAACHDDFCPYCERTFPISNTSVWGLLQLGVKQLVGAIYMIVAGIIRCVRFAVAGALCLVGLIGSCCFGLASRIAHRDDRKLLFRR
jgi:hypothetical protein